MQTYAFDHCQSRSFRFDLRLRPLALLYEVHHFFEIFFSYDKSKCTYCNFNKYHIPNQGQSFDRMETSLINDLKNDLNRIGSDRRLHSVYFGGGTPSLARPIMVEKILKELQHLQTDDGLEITLEANPNVCRFLRIHESLETGKTKTRRFQKFRN